MGAINLIEPGVKYFFNKTLQGCHAVKQKYYNTIYNFIYLGVFVLIVGGVLYIKKRNKPTLEEKEKRKRLHYEYIISKVRNFQDIRAREQPNLQADLAVWQQNPDVQFYNRKIYV
jgi:hypothetical protein